MTVSPQLLDLLKSSEGCRLTPYQDVVGVWTVGYGHTGASVNAASRPITEQQAEDLLAADVAHFQVGVRAFCPDLPEGARFDALTDFAFNLGLAALHGSTMLKRVLAEDWAGAAFECLRWNHAGGKVLPGLTKRRQIESGWLASGQYEP